MNSQRPRLGSGLRLGLRLLLLASTFPTSPTILAARIAEPDTVIYGRVVQRLGPREFPLSRGTLVWRFRTGGPDPRDHTVSTTLHPVGDGRFSYVLRIPHQTRAYDLTVNAQTIPLGATPTPLLDLAVTLDGQPLSFLPTATGSLSLSLSPQERASTHRLDFELASNTPASDSDGDGLPDVWEDEQGLDKYDPNDATSLSPILQPPPSPSALAARTFAQWCAALLPHDSRPSDIIADDDPDRDGLSNFLEYAFDLNPTAIDPNLALALPHLTRTPDNRVALDFQRRTQATDLHYQVESSPDLASWTDWPGLHPDRTATEESARFYRVRVVRPNSTAAAP